LKGLRSYIDLRRRGRSWPQHQFFGGSFMVAATKLSSNTSAYAIDMANAIFGAGMTVPDAGHTGVALTTVNPVLCFTQGSKIRTAKGEVMIQDLCIGDRVITRDSGLLPIRWMSARKVAGLGRFAPVIIEAGTLGAEVQLRLSQHHRVLMRGAIAELYCGEREVLVKAHQLVNGTTIRLDTSGAAIEYFHILFDTHEIIWANGVESESFSPPPTSFERYGGKHPGRGSGPFPGIGAKCDCHASRASGCQKSRGASTWAMGGIERGLNCATIPKPDGLCAAPLSWVGSSQDEKRSNGPKRQWRSFSPMFCVPVPEAAAHCCASFWRQRVLPENRRPIFITRLLSIG
jgi:hypothetical protein